MTSVLCISKLHWASFSALCTCQTNIYTPLPIHLRWANTGWKYQPINILVRLWIPLLLIELVLQHHCYLHALNAAQKYLITEKRITRIIESASALCLITVFLLIPFTLVGYEWKSFQGEMKNKQLTHSPSLFLLPYTFPVVIEKKQICCSRQIALVWTSLPYLARPRTITHQLTKVHSLPCWL